MENMSDEEKAVLKTAKENYGLTSAEQKMLVNLIEKQQKEIEHQKEKRENQKKELAILNAKQIEFNKLVNTVNSYKGQFKRQQKELEELKEKNKHITKETVEFVNSHYISKGESAQKEKQAYIDGTNAADKLCNKKWKDKIKAKIEEVSNGTYDAKIVLQSLLEKE